MATSPDAVRAELAVITTAATAEIAAEIAAVPVERQVSAALEIVGLLVPSYYDAAGSLAVDWYDELRADADPASVFTPSIIGDPATDWIDREIAAFQKTLDADLLDLQAQNERAINEMLALAGKEVARGYRDTVVGNTRTDVDAIGWSRITRPGACKFCVMLAGKGSVYNSRSTAIFAAHTNCHCAARPEFKGGDLGPEANVLQYVASSRRAKTDAAQAARNKRLRAYLNKNYPEARG